MSYEVRHFTGCRNVAFVYSHHPETDEVMLSSEVLWPVVEAHSRIRCGSCGGFIDFLDLTEYAQMEH